MRVTAMIILPMLVAFFSCNSSDNANGPTGGEQLPTTTFSIDPAKDTVLKTPGGALLRIAAGTFSVEDAGPVKLEVKEAYTPAQLSKGSISAHAGDTTLQSSGVLFVRLAAGQSVSILKPFSVSVPAGTPRSDMRVYSGRLEDNGYVSWGTPQPLGGNPGLKLLENGKTVYLANCASCHHLKGNGTAPSLAFLWTRRNRQWLLDYSRNNGKLLWRGDPYTCFLFNRYKMSPMPTFPDLSDADLEGVYQYVTSASKSLGIGENAVADLKPGFDSCAKNDANCAGVIEKMTSMPAVDTTTVVAASTAVDVSCYTFAVDKHGWYNVASSGAGSKMPVDSTALGNGESLDPLQSCPCWCNETAYRKADSIARANSKP
jgi:hypothetical protein